MEKKLPLKKLSNNNGFTLVELMVALGLFAVAIAIAGTILFSSFNISAKNADTAFAGQIGDVVCDYIINEIKTAESVCVSTSEYDSYEEMLYIQDGKIYCKDGTEFVDFYGDEFYNGYNIVAYINTDNFKLSEVTVSVYNDNGDELYTTSSIVRFLNYDLNPASFITEGSGQIDLSVYKVYYNN